jgi:glycolate oxidase
LPIGGRAIKKATGYPLTQLFVGSEGTLGVFTEITLKLIPKPQARGALLAVFPRLEDAAASVTKILNSGIMPATIEIMDKITLRTVEEYLKIGLPQDVEAVILVECDGNAEAVNQETEAIVKLCQGNGAREVKRARNAAERDELWKARQSVSPSLSRLKPNKLGEDITVPRSQIVTMVKQIQEIAQRNNVFIALFGHISDGNLHPNIVCDRRDKEEMKRVQQAAQEIFEAAIALKGTLSGEHGIGFLKKEFLPMDLSPQVIELQRRVKAAFDPHNILNPNKIFPTGTLGAIFY